MKQRGVLYRAFAAVRVVAAPAFAFAGLAASLVCLAGLHDLDTEMGFALAETRALSEAALGEARDARTETLAAIRATGESLARDVRGIERVYSGILAETRKKTVDDVYSGEEIRKRREEGIRLYGDGDYAGALRALKPVRSLARDDDEAMFCLVASEFRINPQDRGLYGETMRALRDLRVGGYRSADMDGIIAYIEGEERAMDVHE